MKITPVANAYETTNIEVELCSGELATLVAPAGHQLAVSLNHGRTSVEVSVVRRARMGRDPLDGDLP